MRIRMIESVAGPLGSFRRNREYDVPEAEGQGFIDAGIADPVTTEPAADPNPAADPVTESEPADSKPAPKKKKTK